MAKKNLKKEDEQLENVSEALNTTEQWFEEHSKMISIVMVAIVAVVCAIILVNTYIIKPKGLEAANENAKAEAYFMMGEWQKALDGDEADCIGFEEIADNYGMFQQGKLAALYAGICHYQLGNYEEAKNYLKSFSASDVNIAPAAKQLLGDAYVQFDELNKAASAFMSAAASENDIIAPMSLMKAGHVYLELGDKKAAHKAFTSIKTLYPNSAEAALVDQYIAYTK